MAKDIDSVRDLVIEHNKMMDEHPITALYLAVIGLLMLLLFLSQCSACNDSSYTMNDVFDLERGQVQQDSEIRKLKERLTKLEEN